MQTKKTVHSSIVDSQLREIRSLLRTRMDGAVAADMRDRGMRYAINWGLTLQYIREIADRYTPCKELALALSDTRVRELRILAMMLMPPEELTRPLVDEFVCRADEVELRRMLAFSLFSRAMETSSPVMDWVSEQLNYPYCAERRPALSIVCHTLIRSLSALTYSKQSELLAMLLRRMEEQANQTAEAELWCDEFCTVALELVKRWARNPDLCKFLLDTVSRWPKEERTLLLANEITEAALFEQELLKDETGSPNLTEGGCL